MTKYKGKIYEILKNILLEPKETYDMPLYLSFRKDYKGNILKFRLRDIALKNREKSKGLY